MLYLLINAIPQLDAFRERQMPQVDTTTSKTPELTGQTIGSTASQVEPSALYNPGVVLGDQWTGLNVCPGSMIVPIDFPSNPIVLNARDFSIDPQTGRPKIDLYVTSDKQLKYQPAADFVVKSLAAKWPEFTESDINLHALKVKSLINEQPIGREQAEQGARGRCQDARIQEALNDPGNKNVLVVSFENTISLEKHDVESMPQAWTAQHRCTFVNDEGELAVDMAGILMQVAIGGKRYESLAYSDGVTLPLEYVRQSQARDCNVTAGSIMEQELGVKGTNWHEAFVGYSRDYLLRICVSRIPFKIID